VLHKKALVVSPGVPSSRGFAMYGNLFDVFSYMCSIFASGAIHPFYLINKMLERYRKDGSALSHKIDSIFVLDNS
jgi:hypothetical protein